MPKKKCFIVPTALICLTVMEVESVGAFQGILHSELRSAKLKDAAVGWIDTLLALHRVRRGQSQNTNAASRATISEDFSAVQSTLGMINNIREGHADFLITVYVGYTCDFEDVENGLFGIPILVKIRLVKPSLTHTHILTYSPYLELRLHLAIIHF
ncbi:hypothetical protein FIBSPDRAFT_233235 [Athelia psychrophila]|uniref:Uncharacterized protein n=1 Tax=Athelia psychrophila TaxID=1759441 RepID=A0A165YHN6_9AGAM|nr:hypothetical protein FIBSPDRAFT_233235 [Fibularhizoctonia sp. CBS 109695]